MPRKYEFRAITDTAGGINDRHRPWFLAENQVAASKGWDPTFDGQRRKRAGVKPLYGNTLDPRGMAIYRDPWLGYASPANLPHNEVLISVNGAITAPYATIFFPDGSTTTFTGVYSDPRGGNDIPFYLVQGYWAGPSQSLRPVLMGIPLYEHHTDPTLASFIFTLSRLDLSGAYETTSISRRPRAGAWMGGRMWIGNDQSLETQASGGWQQVPVGSETNVLSWGSDLSFSRLYHPQNYDAPGLLIEPGLGGNIVALKPWRTAEGEALIIFKQGAICILLPRWGGSGGFLDPGGGSLDTVNSEVRVLASTVGCLGQGTVQEVSTPRGTDIWFLASDGHLRSIVRVEQDQEAGPSSSISYLAQRTMERVNLTFARKAIAEVWDDKYHLSVPLDSNEENSHTLIFDTRTGALIAVEPVAYKAFAVGSGIDSSSVKRYLYAQGNSSVADCSFTGALTGYHVYRLFDESKTLDPGGQTVTAQEETPAYTFGTLRSKKRWKTFDIMLEGWSGATSSVLVEYRPDKSSWTTLGTEVVAQWSGSNNQLTLRKLGLDDVQPSYTLQFRVTSSDTSRPSIVYTGVEANVLPDEQDNDIT